MPPAWLPATVLAAIGIAFALLTRWVAQRIGRSPNRFGRSDTAHDFVGRVYRVAGGVLFAFLVLRLFWPGLDAAAGLIPALRMPGLAWCGLTMMTVGGILIVVAQVQMGSSWRIGLDRERTALATAGLFAVSRNPTFLGMLTLVAGAFLVAPTAVTAAVLAVAWVAFSVQVRMEEEHLQAMHGDVYARYHAEVARWLGRR